jgi:hypothetical protein
VCVCVCLIKSTMYDEFWTFCAHRRREKERLPLRSSVCSVLFAYSIAGPCGLWVQDSLLFCVRKRSAFEIIGG